MKSGYYAEPPCNQLRSYGSKMDYCAAYRESGIHARVWDGQPKGTEREIASLAIDWISAGSAGPLAGPKLWALYYEILRNWSEMARAC